MTATVLTHQQEVARGDRFTFGKNWQQFLETLTEERISLAQQSLQERLGVTTLTGKRFLDIGSGSGLFSLAARRLGATVHSFDYDPQSVACTTTLKARFFPADPAWVIEQGSVLEPAYLSTLGQFDIVYTWGVLHHTGAMWQALTNILPLIAPQGKLVVAIYNDQGIISKRWRRVKQIYNQLPTALRPPFVVLALLPMEAPFFLRSLLRLRPGRYFRAWRSYQSVRGMSKWHDMVDWVGGYPFEVAKPEEIFAFFYQHDFILVQLKTCGGGIGCNEFVFARH